MTIDITFLGTGTSQGIPMIACDCPVCSSDDPHDTRTRTSALLTWRGQNILIDATPELRLQCLANSVRRVDAVLITHTHADHIFGLDDIRRFNQTQRQPIPIYAYPDHLSQLEAIFSYARADRPHTNLNIPRFIFSPITSPFELLGQKIIPLELPHGPSLSLGFRIGQLAYCTDLSTMSDDVVAQLQNLDLLVLGALRPRPHPTHLSFDQAIELVERIKPRRTRFVHLTHAVPHAATQSTLPQNIQLAHDGLTLTVDANAITSPNDPE